MTIFRTLDERLATQICACVERAEADRLVFWDMPLDLAASVAWSGYTTGHLRRMISDGTIVPTNNDCIRRRDLPVKPGHQPPLELGDDAERMAWHNRIRRNRDVA